MNKNTFSPKRFCKVLRNLDMLYNALYLIFLPIFKLPARAVNLSNTYLLVFTKMHINFTSIYYTKAEAVAAHVEQYFKELLLYLWKKVLCFSPHHSVCLSVCVCVCVCVSVCHHVCGEMAGLSNMVSAYVNTIYKNLKMQH